MRRNPIARRFSLILAVLVLTGAARAASSAEPLEDECKNGLAVAGKELDAARLTTVAGSTEVTKAAALLGAAKIQQEFGKYPNCVDKVKRARRFLKKAAVAD